MISIQWFELKRPGTSFITSSPNKRSPVLQISTLLYMYWTLLNIGLFLSCILLLCHKKKERSMSLNVQLWALPLYTMTYPEHGQRKCRVTNWMNSANAKVWVIFWSAAGELRSSLCRWIWRGRGKDLHGGSSSRGGARLPGIKTR